MTIFSCLGVALLMVFYLFSRMSAPCKSCRKLLWVVGVKNCYFTHENGWGKINI